MATTQDALSAWDSLLSLFQIFSRVRFGLLGDGNGTVAIPGKYGWSWIRFDGEQSKLSQVRNYVTNVVDGLPVVVGKRHPSDDFEQVLYIALDLYSQKLTERILLEYLNPPHGESHHGTYGTDPAPIDLNNLMPGRMLSTNPASMSVYVHPFYYPYGMSLDTFAGVAIDLTAYVPGGAGTHLYVMVYVELDSGVLNAVAGDAVPLAATPTIPDAPEWCIPIGVVNLENGMTEIDGDYWQYKALWCSIGQLVTEHTHSSSTQGGTSIVGLEELMFSCHEPLYMIGNAIYPTHTYHSLYIQGMYIDDLDVEEDLIWIHQDPVWGCGQMLMLRPGANGIYTNYNINVRHGVGNIWLQGEQDVTLNDPADHLLLIFDGTNWCDIGGHCCPPDTAEPYGNCYGNEIGWSQAAAVQNLWYDISDANMQDGQLGDITHDGNGQLTVALAGMYMADWSGAFEADAANVHIQITFSINGVETNDGMNHFETVGVNRQDPCTGNAILDLAANDTVNVSIRTTDAGAPDLAIDHLMLRLVLISGT